MRAGVCINNAGQSRWTFWRSCWRGKGQPRSENALVPDAARARWSWGLGCIGNFSTPKLIAGDNDTPSPSAALHRHGSRPPATTAVADTAPRSQWPRATRPEPPAAAAPDAAFPHDTHPIRCTRHTPLAAIITVIIGYLGGCIESSAQEEDFIHEKANAFHGWERSKRPHKSEQMLCMWEGETGTFSVPLLCRR